MKYIRKYVNSYKNHKLVIGSTIIDNLCRRQLMVRSVVLIKLMASSSVTLKK